MTHITPTWPNDGDPGWGDTLNTGLTTIVNTVNAHDDQIADLSSVTSPPSASLSSQGVIQLAGDLGGTAGAPAVVRINGVVITNSPTPGEVLHATSAASAEWGPPSGGFGYRGAWTSADTLGTGLSIDIPLPAIPDFTTRVFFLTVTSKAHYDGPLRVHWFGQVLLTSKDNSLDAWNSDQIDVVAASGFTVAPASSVTLDTADSTGGHGRMTVTFTPNDTDGQGEVSCFSIGTAS